MTLGMFLLDASSDFKECGERLFVHKNMAKYHISKINEALGYDMTNVVETYEVYLAMISYRLVANEWKKQTEVGIEVFNSENQVGTVQHLLVLQTVFLSNRKELPKIVIRHSEVRVDVA